jgi:hypothetical protein
MHTDLARTMVEARHRAAREQHLVQALRRKKRLERQAVRRVVRASRPRRERTWLRLLWERCTASVTAGGAPTLMAVAPRTPEVVAEELGRLLQDVAERIVEHGTTTERFTLEAVADSTRRLAPGAASALVDWDGTETARLHAYGILHGVVLNVLADEDRWWLLERLGGGSGAVPAGLVA